MLPLDLVRIIAGVCERLNIRYFITGSVASAGYGEFRTTRDVDVVVALPPTKVSDFIAEFPEENWYVSEDAARDSVQRRSMFNIISPASGLKIDIVIPSDTAHDALRFARARRIELPGGGAANFAAPEDVILKKLEAFRDGGSDKHLRDITGMLKVSGKEIDLASIGDWAERLNVSSEWSAIIQRLGRTDLPTA